MAYDWKILNIELYNNNLNHNILSRQWLKLKVSKKGTKQIKIKNNAKANTDKRLFYLHVTWFSERIIKYLTFLYLLSV